RELQGVKQGIGEKVEDYSRRFRKLLTRATYGNALPATYQVNNFITGLLPILQYQTYITEPNNLNAAIDRAKLLERATQQTELNLQGINQQIQRNVVQETPIYQKMQKDVKDETIDELTEQMKRMKAHIANLSRNTNVRPMTRPMTGPRIQCRNCGRMGHMERECFRNQTCKRCNKKGHTERVCRENVQQVNYLDTYDYQEYEYDGYYAENNDYPEEEYYNERNNNYNEYDGYYNNYESYPALRSGKELRPGDLRKREVGQREDPIERTKTIRERFQENEEQRRREQEEMDREIRQDFPEQQIPEVQMQQTPVEPKRTRTMTEEHKKRMAQNRK